MVLQLEEKIREKVDLEFKDQISFQAEKDLFVRSDTVLSHCIL